MESQNGRRGFVQTIDFSMQANGTSMQQSPTDLLNNLNRIRDNPTEESAHCSKRDWANERGESSKSNQSTSNLNKCHSKAKQNTSNFNNGYTQKIMRIGENNGTQFDQTVPCIELDSDEDGIELIDLTDTPENDTDMTDIVNENAAILSSLLSAYNIVDISNQTQTASNSTDDVISIATGSDVDMNPLDEGVDTEQTNSASNVEISSSYDSSDDVLSPFNTNVEDNSTGEIDETNDTDLINHSFISMLSPFGVTDDPEDDDIKAEDLGASSNSGAPILSEVSIKDTEISDVDLTGEPSAKKKRKRTRNKKKRGRGGNPPPPHILRKIISQKRAVKMRQQRQKEEYNVKDEKKIEVKGDIIENIKEECKDEGTSQQIPSQEVPSPASTQETSVSRTLATQTAKIFRIAIKDDPDWIKTENGDGN